MVINGIPIEGIYEDVEASGVFGKSKRQKKFFKYLLEKNAIGDTIVAYSVAVDVFDRPIDFDASIDSIVRTETHRLRNRLEIYNGNPNKYWIDFPKGSFDFQVREKSPNFNSGDEKSGSSVFGWNRSLLTTVLAFLILVFIAYSSYFYVTKKPEKLLPTYNVRIADHIKGSDEYDFLNEKKFQILSRDFWNEATQFSDVENTDYVINLGIVKSEKPSDLIYLNVYDRNKNIIFSSRLSDEEFEPNIKDVLGLNGAVPKHYSKDLLVPDKIRETYNCLLDANLFGQKSHTPSKQGVELYNCLNLQESFNAKERSSLMAAKAWLAYDQIKEYAEYGLEDPLKEMDNLLSELRTYSDLNPEYYQLSIIREKLNYPLDRKKLRFILEQVLTDDHDNRQAYYSAALTAAYNLGEWNLAEKLIEKYFANADKKVSSGYYVLTALNLVENDFESALINFDKIPNVNAKINVILETTIACKLSLLDRKEAIKKGLLKFKINTYRSYIEDFSDSRYTQALNDIFTSESLKGCFVFDKE